MPNRQKIVIILDENNNIENIITDIADNLEIVVMQTNPQNINTENWSYIDDNAYYIYKPTGEVNPGLTQAIFNAYFNYLKH